MSFIDKKAQKINIHSYLFFFPPFAIKFYLFIFFFFFTYVQVLCNVRTPTLDRQTSKPKTKLTFVDFKTNKQKKNINILSHQMESEVKNAISQQAKRSG